MKKIICLIFAAAFFIACEKQGELLLQPTYTTFSITSSSPDQYYEILLGDSVIVDSLDASRKATGYVITGKQQLRIRNTKSNTFFVDSLVDVQRPGLEFSLVSLDAESDPLILSGESLQTSPPQEGFRKISLLNIDASPLLKGKTIDVRLYSLGPDGVTFILLGEFRNVNYLQPSDYIELEAQIFETGMLYLEIADSNTGEIVLPVESWQGNMMLPYDDNNVYLMKMANQGDETWTYVYADMLLALKL